MSDVLKHLRNGLRLELDEIVGDPWNGSGTTTQVAEEQHIRSWGGDINPAMVVVAKARLLGSHVSPSEFSLCEAILLRARDTLSAATIEGDPLRSWFKADSAATLRAIEVSIADLLDPGSQSAPSLSAGSRVGSLSPLASFFYLALFRTVGQLIEPFRASNPTWIKKASDGREKLAPGRETIQHIFRTNVRQMAGADQSMELSLDPAVLKDVSTTEHAGHLAYAGLSTIQVAPSTALPLKKDTLSAVISSPPYCTRIDYAVATSPELAVLGLSEMEFGKLRDAMIGTSTITDDRLAVDKSWGRTCQNFLKDVERHPSKASKSYYLRSHLQYFDGLNRSLKEIQRVLRAQSPCILVVQDSFYKEVHNDLATIVVEMASELGWHREERHDYELSQVMARMNKAAQKYRKSTGATESVLVFTT